MTTMHGTTTPPADAAPLRPVRRAERIVLLDVLRGFALAGILLANIHIFSGFFYRGLVGDVVTTGADDVVLWLTHFLVDGKFYSLFSLLFGIGFHVFIERAEAKGMPAVPLFRRRAAWLFVIGLLHAVFLWSGDILTVYALMAFVLLAFRNVGDRALLRWAAVMLALPVAVYAVMWATGMNHPLAPPPDAVAAPSVVPDASAGGEAPFDPLQMMLTGYAGGYRDVLLGNSIALFGRWMDLIITVRFPKVLGMFLIGFWIGRVGLARAASAHTGLLRRVCVTGFLVGLPANAYLAWAVSRIAYLPADPAGFMYVLAYAVGVPALSLAYAAGIALLLQRAGAARMLGVFAPVGRMALTNYLLQSLLGALIFYGYGLGLFGQVGPALAALIALGMFAVQVPLSHFWLSRYAYGPAEWLWRRLTYRTPFPMRRQEA